MKFKLGKWLLLYKRVQEAGKLLQESRPSYDEFENYVAPKKQLSKDAQLDLEMEIKILLNRSARYLDECGMAMQKPLWIYDKYDTKTHRSNENFRYEYLIDL